MKDRGKKLSNIKKESQSGFKTYFQGVKAEWSKITWPERKQVVFESIVVLGVVFFFTALIYVMDISFQGLVGFLDVSR